MSIDPEKLKQTLLTDIKVELTEEFDLNFERKGFFSEKWKPRSFPARRGSLLVVSNKLRGGIKSEVISNGVRFSSSAPYAAAHNEGAQITVTPRMKKYFWRQYITTRDDIWKFMALKKVGSSINLPQRQFIGDGPDTARLIENVIKDFCKEFDLKLSTILRKP